MRIPNSLLLLSLSLGVSPFDANQASDVVPTLDSTGFPSFEPAPDPSPRLDSPVPNDLGKRIDSRFARAPTQRLHVQLERPLYRPGDTVLFKSWALRMRDLTGNVRGAITLELIDPSGALVERKLRSSATGGADHFDLPDTAPGGRWAIRATVGQTTDEHAFVVTSNRTPTVRKHLTFLRDSYGPGDTVEALVELEHATQGALADRDVHAMLSVDGLQVLDETLRTDATGAVFLRAPLPSSLHRGQGLLTVTVNDGGIAESISRSVPIVVGNVDLTFYPEGGQLIDGLPGRVYFEAKDDHGAPTAVEGYIADDRGRRVTTFSSLHDGLGRFSFRPVSGRTYRAHLSAPAPEDRAILVPAPREDGCTLRTYDDVDSRHPAIRVGVRCTTDQTVFVTAVQRDTTLDAAAVRAGPDDEAVVYLEAASGLRQGAARITLFGHDRQPLAERLVYRGAGRDLSIQVTPDQDTYGPRDRVKLAVSTRNAQGEPVAANIALSVVDDALINLADDTEGNLLSRLYLRPELLRTPTDPAWYFDPDEPDATAGLDRLMGTKGFRRFEWGFLNQTTRGDVLTREFLSRVPTGRSYQAATQQSAGVGIGAAAGTFVRTFPLPDEPGFDGVRTDFRESAFWAPSVRTDVNGQAHVEFTLTDAITTFRITTEGVGAGLAGRDEATFTSVLAQSVAATIPTVVSAGDLLDLPLTVTNTRPEPLTVDVSADFDSSLLKARKVRATTKIAANSASTVWMPLKVGRGQETVALELVSTAKGSTDTLQRTLEVVETGVPRSFHAAGELDDVRRLQLDLEPHQVGSLTASVVLYPTPTASLVEGLDGLIRMPGGCFEQTSSTNWPNVAIVNYLEEHHGNERLRAKSAQALEVGYERLTSFQVETGGFETFGHGPGKEVLSAFGLLQFHDMRAIYDVNADMLRDDVDFLLSRRDGQGGFNSSGASIHGYGSAPKPVSDGFITYALVAAGHAAELTRQIARQAKVARTSNDPYVLALAARTLLKTHHADAQVAVERLAGLQDDTGAFTGAQTSITRSHEANLDVESTALASLALMEGGPVYSRQYSAAVNWLIDARTGGTWGATQATAMALQALTAHAARSKRTTRSGQARVKVNGETVGQVSFAGDRSDPIVFDGLEEHLQVGDNRITLHLTGAPMPFTLQADWLRDDPPDDPGRELDVTTHLAQRTVAMGETVRLTAEVSNRTDRIVPSPIARIGLPAGLQAPIWQLKELQERGVIAFYETRPREVTLYWEGIHPTEVHRIALDLDAVVPGRYTGPSSSAYPYYNDDEKAWDDGLVMQIERP